MPRVEVITRVVRMQPFRVEVTPVERVEDGYTRYEAEVRIVYEVPRA